MIHNPSFLKRQVRNTLAVQQLRLCASTSGHLGLIPGQGAKISHAIQHSPKKNKKNKTGIANQNKKGKTQIIV